MMLKRKTKRTKNGHVEGKGNYPWILGNCGLGIAPTKLEVSAHQKEKKNQKNQKNQRNSAFSLQDPKRDPALNGSVH